MIATVIRSCRKEDSDLSDHEAIELIVRILENWSDTAPTTKLKLKVIDGDHK